LQGLERLKETSRGVELIFLNLENEERSLAMWVMLVVLKYSMGQEQSLLKCWGMTRHLQMIFPQEITLGKSLHVHLFLKTHSNITPSHPGWPTMAKVEVEQPKWSFLE
jgi:hypothetical protein